MLGANTEPPLVVTRAQFHEPVINATINKENKRRHWWDQVNLLFGERILNHKKEKQVNVQIEKKAFQEQEQLTPPPSGDVPASELPVAQ